MSKNSKLIDVHIDKITNSIEEVITAISKKTVVLPFIGNEKGFKSKNWKFNWKSEVKKKDAFVFKLVILGKEEEIQGLISISLLADHVHVNIIESANFNIGKNKKYFGVSANLFAFACLLSYRKGFKGVIAFLSKTKLIKHYIENLNCTLLYKNHLFMDEKAANNLIQKYFSNER